MKIALYFQEVMLDEDILSEVENVQTQIKIFLFFVLFAKFSSHL